MIEDLLKKLRFFYRENRDEGKKAAASMIKILKNVGTDSTIFPEYEIEQIRSAAKMPWEK